MLAKRRRDAGDKTAPRLPDTVARLIQFTVVTRTRSGRVKASTIRVLTTLLNHDEFPRPRDRRPVRRKMAGIPQWDESLGS